jgi:hypothetical protein
VKADKGWKTAKSTYEKASLKTNPDPNEIDKLSKETLTAYEKKSRL